MKNKTKVIIGIVIAIVLITAGIIVFNIYSDKTRLTVSERHWVNDSLSTIQNINVLNDNKVFGNVGKGVFFDFLTDFAKEYDININPIAIKSTDKTSSLALHYKNTLNDGDLEFYRDHYVILKKSYELLSSYDSLNDLTLGITKDNMSHVSSYLSGFKINYEQFNNREELLKEFNEDKIDYIVVPLVEYMDTLLENNLYVVKHLSDIPTYYVIENTDNDFGRVLKKYFLKWQDNFKDYYNESLFRLFTSKLNISETEVDALRSMDFNYGFVNNSPYEVITGGNYGGIVAIYLKEFSSFANLDIKFTKYKNFNRFVRATENNSINFYFNYYNLTNNYQTVKGGLAIKYSIIANNKNSIVINSLGALKNKTVYVLEDSILKNTLQSVSGVNIKTYKDNKELFRLTKKDVIILLDKNIFDYYKNDELKNYSERYVNYASDEYSFKINNNNAFYKLFERYINTIDYNEALNKGLLNHTETIKSGTLLGKMAKYFLVILFVTAIVIYAIYRRSKKITIIKKIRKEDKMKYIDQLTSLKNRNYLNENIDNWNNNKVYPQAMIVIDLNNIQYINDTLGYEEGDKQIKAVANILIKTQLDYSDVMRTDGNEFLIYLIGYTKKQITSYIHKLNKEFKKLPYEYGAEFGYSMITDDIKTIEDAINEAVEQMKSQKKDVSKDANDEIKN